LILTIGGIKGGTGKTTIATNFAAIAAGDNWAVLLVDADEQESASAWAAMRSDAQADTPQVTTIKLTGQNVRNEIVRLAGKFNHIIIDTGGRDTSSQRAALSVSDRVLVPFAPRCFDVWTVSQVAVLIDMMKAIKPSLSAYACLNRADPPGQGSDNEDACRLISGDPRGGIFLLDESPVGNRKAFAHAASTGLAVTELRRDLENKKASEEIVTLYQRCFDVEPSA
jgi:chromosome partitioning protein